MDGSGGMASNGTGAGAGVGPGVGGSTGSSGANSLGGGPSGATGGVGSGSTPGGGASNTNGGTPGGGAGNGGSTQTTGGSGPSTGGMACTTIAPGPSPIRRLTTYEYNSTIRDLLTDTTSPGSELPPQADSKHNLFGNDANEQDPSPLLIEKYQAVAESVAARATADATALGRLHACTKSLTAANEEACAKSIVTTIGPRALRRTLTSAEIDEFVALYRSTRALGTTVTFNSGVAAMLEAMLQAPDFLYRVEFGVAEPTNSAVKRIAGREMATRLSYLFWGTMPDDALFQLADSGMLDNKAAVLAQAKKMLDDGRARPTVAFFFDNLLPIPDLGALTRPVSLFPTFSSAIGVAMRQEVQSLLAYEIFENKTAVAPYAAGSWPALLTTPYTFVNEALFKFYGASTFAPGTTVTGTTFQKVNLNTEQRLGLLTLGGITAGGTTSNMTNPVLRGSFVINKLMCMGIELPVGLAVSPPEPYTGKTARERYTKHSANDTCAGCHRLLDPMGFPFENYDAVGLYRATERWTDKDTGMVYDTPIDASGAVPGVTGAAKNAVELSRLLATSPMIGTCFASHWMQFGYGRSVDSTADACNLQSVQDTFKGTGYNVKELLLALTQADAFLYKTAQ